MVRSQEEALSSGQTYDYCLLTTKCLPDVLPNARLLAPSLASDQIKSYALIQNGLDVERDVYEALRTKGREAEVPIVTAAAWIGLMTSPDGKRIHWSGPQVSVMAYHIPLGADTCVGRRLYGAGTISTTGQEPIQERSRRQHQGCRRVCGSA